MRNATRPKNPLRAVGSGGGRELVKTFYRIYKCIDVKHNTILLKTKEF